MHVNYKISPEKYEDNSGIEKNKTLKKFRKVNKPTQNPQNKDGLTNKYYLNDILGGGTLIYGKVK